MKGVCDPFLTVRIQVTFHVWGIPHLMNGGGGKSPLLVIESENSTLASILKVEHVTSKSSLLGPCLTTSDAKKQVTAGKSSFRKGCSNQYQED
jgi:hypothetical protein